MELKVRKFSHGECRITFDSEANSDFVEENFLAVTNEVIGDYSITSFILDKYKSNTKIKSCCLFVTNDNLYDIKLNMIELISITKKIAAFLLSKLKLKSINIITYDELLVMEVNDPKSLDL